MNRAHTSRAAAQSILNESRLLWKQQRTARRVFVRVQHHQSFGVANLTTLPMASALYPPAVIAGHVVLVTGASSGIGQACARRFAEAGCSLVLLARRAERLAALQAELTTTYSVAVHTVTLDVRDTAGVLALPDTLPDKFKSVDILVNNAGLALGTASVLDNSLEDAATMLETNVTSVIAFTKTFAKGMVERNRGHVINISSIAGHEAYGGGSMYCASKHALGAFTTAARHDLVGTEVRVTAISPGAVNTEFSKVRYGGDQAKADAVYAGFTPLSADDIADNVLYSCTRPAHVQIGEIIVFATRQASAKGIARDS